MELRANEFIHLLAFAETGVDEARHATALLQQERRSNGAAVDAARRAVAVQVEMRQRTEEAARLRREQVLASLVVPPSPTQQQQLLSIIDDAFTAYRANTGNPINDRLSRDEAVAQRERAMCQLLGDLHVTNWVGRIREMRLISGSDLLSLGLPNDGDRIYLSVAIGNRVSISTHNNFTNERLSSARLGGTTDTWSTIPLRSEAGAALRNLRVGSDIVFSGIFYRDAPVLDHRPSNRCLHEFSITIPGSMSSPEFLFRFTSLRAQ